MRLTRFFLVSWGYNLQVASGQAGGKLIYAPLMLVHYGYAAPASKKNKGCNAMTCSFFTVTLKTVAIGSQKILSNCIILTCRQRPSFARFLSHS